MKHNFFRYALALAIVFSLTAAFAQTGTAATVPAATGPQPTKVGVIDIQEAILASNEGQREVAALNTRFAPKKAELDKLAKDIDDLQKQINAQGDKLNPETLDKMRNDLATKQKDYKRALEDAQGDANQAQDELMSKIGNKLYPILDKYARENGYAMILDEGRGSFASGGPLIWANLPSVDLTKTIIDLYNAQSGVPAPPKASNTPSAPTPQRPGATRPH